MKTRICGVFLAAGLAAATICAATAAAGGVPQSTAGLPAVPAAWPSTHLEIGLTDSPGGAAALHSSGAYKFRYQYLAGGVNTGSGWSTWNANAKFADYYVDESVAVGITPVFIYYQLLQSSPAGGAENTADLNNLKNTSTMHAYWADVRLLMQHLGAYSQTIVVDVEPDLWGYIQQASTSDNGASVPAAVASSGDTDMAGLPNNAAGFAQGFVHLRNEYAPNVLLGYELSMWGTLTDPISQHIPIGQIGALAARSTAFEQSLGATFNLVFTDPSDRDAGFDQYINGDGGASWWSSTDYDRFNAYVSDFVVGVGLRMVLWQIPLGNTKMRAMDNTWGHYQDNHVEWWLDDTTGHLAATVNAGVIALLYGGGADGTTSATDAQGDGVTNPPAINGNTIASYSADDDGGYFRHQANAYYTAGAMSLPAAGSGSSPTPTPSPTAGATYHTVTPARVLDSRIGKGGTTFHGQINQTVTIANGTSGVPTDAVAVTGNVTITQQTSLGYVTVAPSLTSGTQPATSTINFPLADNRANGITVPLAAGGKLDFMYWTGSTSDTIGVIFDVTGYFSADASGSTYHTVTPARVLDSRIGKGGTTFHGQINQTVTIANGTSGVPTDAVAVTGNVTITQQTSLGYVTVAPSLTSGTQPATSTINFPLADNRANGITVPLAAGGKLDFMYWTGSTSDTIGVIFDVTGYFE